MKIIDTFKEFKDCYYSVPDGPKYGELYYIKEDNSIYYKTNNQNEPAALYIENANPNDMNKEYNVVVNPDEVFKDGYYGIQVTADAPFFAYIFKVKTSYTDHLIVNIKINIYVEFNLYSGKKAYNYAMINPSTGKLTLKNYYAPDDFSTYGFDYPENLFRFNGYMYERAAIFDDISREVFMSKFPGEDIPEIIFDFDNDPCEKFDPSVDTIYVLNPEIL